MSLVGSLRGVQANPKPCNSDSNSNHLLLGDMCEVFVVVLGRNPVQFAPPVS